MAEFAASALKIPCFCSLAWMGLAHSWHPLLAASLMIIKAAIASALNDNEATMIQ